MSEPAIEPAEAGTGEREVRRSARWPWILLLLLVVLLPLGLGGNRPWAWSVAGLVASALLLAWGALVAVDRAPFAWRPALIGPAVLFAIVTLWLVVQTWAPVPEGLANPIWQMASEALGRGLPGRISADPEGGQVGLIHLLTNATVFWLALQYGRDRDRAERLLEWIVLASLAYAIYGIVNYVAGNETLLFAPRVSYASDVTGTFVNRNNYATYAGVTLLAAVVLAIRHYRARLRVADPALSRAGRTMEAMAGLPAVYATAGVVIAMAWLQSHSRMGFASTAGAMVVLLALLRLTGIIRGWLILGVLALCAGAALLLVSGGGVIDRLDATSSFDRASLFDDVRAMIGSTPWIGSGYGSFAAVFSLFRHPLFATGSDITQAHNTYYELCAEIGIPATILLCGAVAWLALLCLIAGFRRTRDQVIPILAFAATVLVGLHATTDFSLQIPGMVVTYMAILGVGVAQSWSPEARRRGR